MAYFGKEFKFEKEENYEEFIKSISAADETAAMFLTFKPNYKIDKKGDEYVMTLTNGDFKKEINFKPGVAFEEDMSTGLKVR
ncbi:fatty acid-binding protein 1-like [Ostrinia furnacalis]|uniref:fatty acid-binding protein 1-like n=1 Tax=Ostrinia furnacalis TaxID=93504 RepID=UPI00104036CC|nr:fatty acid-binding protein 1-like [Ostrinia furnacalis]